METEFQNAMGKSIGEVLCDIAEFLSTPYVIGKEKPVDLCTLLPELNMHEQFSFALLSEARHLGMSPAACQNFYLRACADSIGELKCRQMLALFESSEAEFAPFRARYGNHFGMTDGSYWATCLALGIDNGEIDKVLHYLRMFTVTLMEFAYMEGRNPDSTYTWRYYESFRAILDELLQPAPTQTKVLSVGGSVGKREGNSYLLSLGVDIENPNPDRMAQGICINIRLKDKGGNLIVDITDKLLSIDPATTYHYGITRKITGESVASFSVTAYAEHFLKLSTPIMQHVTVNDASFRSENGNTVLSGRLQSAYDTSLRAMTLHYQFRDENDRLLGGNSEWLLDGIAEKGEIDLCARTPLTFPTAKRILYSTDFNALELVREQS
ncbi:MAG: hypothetical protein IKB75_06290 [Clostridia bacterium]|nr:hypothetical protein [Clostridia bacterium]